MTVSTRQTLNADIRVRITESEKDLLGSQAKSLGLNLSEFVRRELLNKAKPDL